MHVLLEDLYLYSSEEMQAYRGGIIKYYRAVTVNARNNEKKTKLVKEFHSDLHRRDEDNYQ